MLVGKPHEQRILSNENKFNEIKILRTTIKINKVKLRLKSGLTNNLLTVNVMFLLTCYILALVFRIFF